MRVGQRALVYVVVIAAVCARAAVLFVRLWELCCTPKQTCVCRANILAAAIRYAGTLEEAADICEAAMSNCSLILLKDLIIGDLV